MAISGNKKINPRGININGGYERALFLFCLFAISAFGPSPIFLHAQTISETYNRNLSIGDIGTDVASLQSTLIIGGFLSIGSPTGYFGTLTQAALEKWQASEGIPATGYFGTLSRAMITSGQAPLITTTTTVTSAFPQNLSFGDDGSEVSALQSILINKGFLSITDPTGYFGTLTQAALEKWQASEGIPATGYFGSLSRASIFLAEAPNNSSSSQSISIFTPTTTTTSMTITTPMSTVYSSGGGGGDDVGSLPIQTPPVSLPPQSSPASTTALNYNYGFSVGQNLLGLSSTTLNTYLNDITSLDIGWIRFDIEWEDVQPDNSSQYNWGSIDQLVSAANTHHIKLLAILDYTPAWAETSICAVAEQSDRCPPADPAQFATFAQAAVNRYAPQGISDWEIWNEPNLAANWEPTADANGYTALLKAAYVAIKAVQPAATVISGGLSPAATDGSNIAPIDFLTSMYAAGAHGYFDAVGDHPYSYSAMPLYYAPWNAWSQIAGTTPSIESVMAANGDGDKKIWLTEYGAPTGGPGVVESSTSDTVFAGHPDHVTESVQAAMISQAVIAVQGAPWAGPLFIYTYKDLGTDQSTIENFFGVVRSDGSDKPAYTTLKMLLTNQ